MFGVKVRIHRPLLILLIIVSLLLIFLLLSKKKSVAIKKFEIDKDEDINLIDLFNLAYKLTYQAGQAIKLIKNTKKTFQKKIILKC